MHFCIKLVYDMYNLNEFVTAWQLQMMRLFDNSALEHSKKLAVIFFVTADPIHYAHLQTLFNAAKVCNADTAILVPVSKPPYKLWRTDIGIEHKVAMCKLMVEHQTRFDNSVQFLVESPLVSKTINPLEYFIEFSRTMSKLARAYTTSSLVITGGLDFYEKLSRALRWIDYAHTFNLASQAYEQMIGLNQFLFFPQVRSRIGETEVSSTLLREYIRAGAAADVSKYIPYEIYDYIQLNHLYQSKRECTPTLSH